MGDVLLVILGAVLGAALGVGVKMLIDPVLERRSRQRARGDTLLESAVEHVDGIREHIQEVRNAVTSQLGFDLDAIAATIARTLTARWGPERLTRAAEYADSEALTKFASNASEAWTAVGVARMDLENDVVSDDEMSQPVFAVQWYETQLGNFEHEARQLLSGRS